MPELPEVQTVVSEMQNSLVGQKITDVITLRDKIRYDIPDLSVIIGAKVASVERRAKYIIITCHSHEGGNLKIPAYAGMTEYNLIMHLGMSGKIHIGQPRERVKHDHIVFEFANGAEMVFNDARRFGFVIFDDGESLAHLGVEPLSDEFDADFLLAKLKGKKQPIKTAIMDQALVVGVGNIYAAEALFRSKILPTRLAGKVTKAECKKLVQNIKNVLAEAIESGGSTLRDYVRSSGDLGYFQHCHQVYGHAGEPCVVCKTIILNTKLGGRSSFFCPVCQK
jgi:formamidopyrimidine-DNA glycosylase